MVSAGVIRANRSRMKRELDAQARVGRWGRTGLARPALTREYNEVRDLVRGWMEAAGLRTRVDAVGNLFGRKEGRGGGLPAVMCGSHLDSGSPQSPGGRFDGSAGVLAALEAVRRIAETGRPHDHPIEVAAFVGEESHCGMTTFGSSVAAGRLTPDDLRATPHPPSGRSIFDALRAAGGDPLRLKECALPRGYLKAFLELHIEQGPLLEAQGVPIGVVDIILPVARGRIRFEGVTAHAGGQPMSHRRDAAMAAAELMLEMEEYARRGERPRGVVVTFGRASFEPGWATVVPGGATLACDVRARTSSALGAAIRRMGKALERIREKRGVKGRLFREETIPPCPTSPGVRRALVRGAAEAGWPWMRLASGAIHDSCRMAELCPVGMVFVPSVRGLSHTPRELTRLRDLVAGTEVLASALLRLADRRVRV